MRAKSRRCVDCGAEGLPLTRLAPHPGPRCATHHRRFRTERSENRKDALLSERYGITGAQYRQILEAQGGVCYICQKKPGRKRLSVDHDHKMPCCGVVHPVKNGCPMCIRGLLHSKCNSFLGWCRDDPTAGTRMHDYLKNPPARAVLMRG